LQYVTFPDTNLSRHSAFMRQAKGALMQRIVTLALLAGLALSATACACRPGHVGPYGGVHPGRCWVG
jgi:hypothetical protein